MTAPTRSAATAYALLTLTALFWAGNTLVGRAVIDELPPLGFGFWRSFGAFLIIAPIGLPRVWRARAVIVEHWRFLVLLGTLGMTGFALLVFVALHHTDAVNGTLIQGTQPIIIVVLSWLILGRAITRLQGLGIVVALAGLMVIVARGDAAVLAGLRLNVGDPIMWLGVLSHGIFSVMLVLRPQSLDLICLMTVAFFVGAVTSLPFHLWEIADGRPMPLTLTAAWAVGFVALFPSVLAQLFWAESIRRVGAAMAGYFLYLIPVFGPVLAIVLLGETFAWYHAVGIAAIFAGIYFATTSPSAKE